MKKKKQRHVRPIERKETKRPGVSALKTASPLPSRISPARAGRDPRSLLAMQRNLGNRAVQRVLRGRVSHLHTAPAALQRGGGGAGGRAAKRKDYAFIMGQAPKGTRDKFYTYATRYYRSKLPKAQVTTNRQNLAAVFAHLRAKNTPVGNLYIVSHASPDGRLLCPLTASDTDASITYEELQAAIDKHPHLFKLPRHVIDSRTTIYIKGCYLGRAKRMLELVDKAFGGRGTVFAPTHYQYFGQKPGTGTLYEAFKEHYIERRGSVKLGRRGLLTAFMTKYRHLNLRRMTWLRLLRKARRMMYEEVYTAFKNTLPLTKRVIMVALRRQYPKGRLKIGNEVFKIAGVKQYAGKPYKKVKKRSGTEYVYTVIAVSKTNPARRATWDVMSPIVPHGKAARARAMRWARAKLARPNAYGWKVVRSRKGSRLTMRVVGRMTEYAILDTFIRTRQGKFYRPSRTDKTHYGTTR